ncbi:hypothetical protein EC968_010607 [Mortierella alpina]|nr:hypothetical protein EC968_010607 [Mortierella alpina]
MPDIHIARWVLGHAIAGFCGATSQAQTQAQTQTQAQLNPPRAVPLKDRDTIFGCDVGSDQSAGPSRGRARVINLGPQPPPADSILQPISKDPPPGVFQSRPHPLQPVRVRPQDLNTPPPTNKFYGGLLIPDSQAPLWTHPYGLRWDSKEMEEGGEETSAQQGLSISHVDDTSKTFGPENMQGARFYTNPFIVSLGLSAVEFDSNHEMSIGDFGEFGCTMILSPSAGNTTTTTATTGDSATLQVPIIRGMAFVSGLYHNLTPRIFSETLVQNLTLDSSSQQLQMDGWVKYRFLMGDKTTWLLYARNENPNNPMLKLEKKGEQADAVVATSGTFTGLLQIAKVPLGNEVEAEKLYDAAVGVYATSGDLVVRDMYTQNNAAGYRIDWILAGNSSKSFMHFTLPHHRDILTDTATATSLVLPSTTKGKMVAYLGQSWHFLEPDRITVGFLPDGWPDRVSQERLTRIREQVQLDVQVNFENATNAQSLYYTGKALAKFGLMCLVAADVLKEDPSLKQTCLEKLKTVFSRFLENKQQFPLVYDTTWKGLITSQAGPDVDFGNGWYNDHHYHYGYYVHTAAIIRHLDPTWNSEALSSFVHGLIRDVANPSSEDPYFPVFRYFDWFMGHSWSQGLFLSEDGKNEESTSEDVNFYYAMSLWASVSSEPNLERLGQVMLTVARRSIQAYFLMEDDNANHPKAFVGNKVTGILFENKVDHTTFFSSRTECIQGIQMIPATPVLPLIRRTTFVRQEWDVLLSPIVGNITDGWKSVLMTNYGVLDKDAAWDYFATGNTTSQPLDDGLSRTWALFYVASLRLPTDQQTPPAPLNPSNGSPLERPVSPRICAT